MDIYIEDLDEKTYSHLIDASDECNCSICQANSGIEEPDPEEPQMACQHACQCCEEVEVPEEYKVLPTEVVGGSSYICGGRRVRKLKRRKRRGGTLIGGRRKLSRKPKGGASKYRSFVKREGKILRKKHPNASPQAIMKALGKLWRESKH